MLFAMPGQNFAFTGRSTIGGDAPATGYSASAVQNYDLDDVARWQPSGGTPKHIVIDRGAAFVDYANADVVALFGFSVSDFDAVANTCGLASIDLEQSATGAFAGEETKLVLTPLINGTPLDGPGNFAGPTVVAPLDTIATQRYLRIILNASAAVNVDVGCVWASAATDTADDAYGAPAEFDVADINRNIKTEQYAGGQSITDRPKTRRVALDLTYTARAWHLFSDAIEGRLTGYVDDPSNPWLFSLDINNKTRANGRHYWGGLWTFDGNVTSKLTSATVDGARAVKPRFILRAWR
ncbi:hypothetical protein N9164_12510 [Draconibacterium sp.]|nr:hypothetical protein [Draconibacterium sp.]